MRKATFGLAAMVLPAIVGGLATTACGEDGLDPTNPEAICGPCGVVAQGDVGISGNAKLDGFFAAVAQIGKVTTNINANFEANISDLEAAFGVEASGDIQARVDALITEINAEVSANASGGLVVNYVGPKCQANVSVAVEAQAQCEVKGGCEAEVDPGNISVECEGKCEGSCSAECTGGFKCDFSAGAECSGMCEGSCELDAAATCEGTCRGSCSGTCSAYNGAGECAGSCDGMCDGTCELSAAAECSGTCTGSCEVEAEADCMGEAPTCSGSCSGECSGGCTGEATPPSASASCDASADCKAQAKAQASANVECTPPQLEFGFEFTGNVNAQASFVAKMGQLKTSGIAILQGFAQYKALIDGEVNGEVVFETSPLLTVTQSLNGVISAGVEGDLFADIAPGRIGCVIPALEASVTILGDVTSEATANLQAQATFAAELTGGFGG